MPGKKYIYIVSNKKSTNLKEMYFVSKYEIQTDIAGGTWAGHPVTFHTGI